MRGEEGLGNSLFFRAILAISVVIIASVFSLIFKYFGWSFPLDFNLRELIILYSVIGLGYFVTEYVFFLIKQIKFSK